MLDQVLKDVDRASIIRMVAIYLLVYALLNVCGGLFAIVGGGLAAVGSGIGAAAVRESATGMTSAQAAETNAALAAAGGLSGILIVMGILYVVSAPVFLAAAFGLFQRKSWGRMLAIIAMGISIFLSVINLGSNGFFSIVWILISGVAIYLFITDPQIKAQLSA